MPEVEQSRLVLLAGDKVMSRVVREDGVDVTEAPWEFSDTIPGVMLVGIWQIYHLMWIVLSKTEAGHYQIFRSTNLQQFELVHDHTSEIYNLFWLDDGHMLFCATDGWWKTTNTGVAWTEIEYLSPAPSSRQMAAIQLSATEWLLVAYESASRKIWQCSTYPSTEWAEAYDPSSLWSDKWYPAIDGSAAGVLVGVGPYLLRASADDPTTWEQIQEVDGIIKSIRISDNSNKPTFLITVEGADVTDAIYTTDDLGDTLTPMGSRAWPMATVESIVPTGGNSISTHFAVVGRRSPDGGVGYRQIAFGW